MVWSQVSKMQYNQLSEIISKLSLRDGSCQSLVFTLLVGISLIEIDSNIIKGRDKSLLNSTLDRYIIYLLWYVYCHLYCG